MRKHILLAVSMLIVVVSQALAHHAFSAEFDADKPVELRGTVSKVEWVNPHSWIYLDVKGPNGKVVTWAFELGTPNSLFRHGWKKDSVPNGIELLIRGYRAKNGKPLAN